MRTTSARVVAAFVSRTAARAFQAFGLNDFAQLSKMGRQFAVLSGYRAELGKHENKDRHGDLVADLQRMGYRKWAPIKSSWEDMATKTVHGEKSVLVPGMSFGDAVHLMKAYKQDAVVYKDPSGTIGIYFQNGTAIMAFDADQKDLAVLTSPEKGEYSKAKNFSFGLQLVDDRMMSWSGGPITKDKLVAQLAQA